MRSLLLAFSPVLAWALSTAPVLAQTPATYVPFGQGCSSQAAHPFLYSPRPPVIGREFIAAVRNVRANSMGALIVGASRTLWGPRQLPASLSFLGAPSCQLLVSPDFSFFVGTGSGTAYLRAPVPPNPGLVGLTLYHQFWAPDPQANPAGIAMSNGATAVIGSCLCLPPQSITEDFKNDTMLDKSASGGTWASGKLVAAKVGGTGRLGAFHYEIAPRAGNTYLWNTDKMVIPATFTESGKAETVTNGVFEFSSFVLPAGVTVRFVGSNPLQIKVRGNSRVEGTLDAGAVAVGRFAAAGPTGWVPTGQKGGFGGPGGGLGGQGGDACPNTGARARFNGRNGQDVRLPRGNSYAALAAGTGGKGSPLFPNNGVNTTYCALNNTFAPWTAAGGGGGGFQISGQDGRATVAPCNARFTGSAANSGGRKFDLGTLKNNNTGPNRSLGFYAVGGSGGGGAGSHPLLTLSGGKWLPGSGGAGGGGVVAFRVGRDFVMRFGSAIQVRGGAGSFANGVGYIFNVPAPGGGGSGGAVLLQVEGNASLGGVLDAAGGKGGILDNRLTGHQPLRAISHGGDGAPGYIRVETPIAKTPRQLGKTVPIAGAGNVGKLGDTDVVVTTQSRFYKTGLADAPSFLRYEIEATIAGKRVVYSDDPTLKNPNFVGAAAGGPLRFRVQGAQFDVAGKLVKQGPWRDNVRANSKNSLAADDVNSWRFQLIHDRRTSLVEVNKITVWFQQ